MSDITIRSITVDDEETLWHMLYYAAHMDEDEDKTIADAKTDSFLKKYVEKWGKPSDLGFIAEDNQRILGAVWVRQYEDTEYPELSIAVLPNAIGQGIGTQLMQTLIYTCQGKFEGIMLSVRANNPAYRLYQRFDFKTTREIINRVGTLSYEMYLPLNT